MRILPHATAELIGELQSLADLLDETIGRMDPEHAPVGMAQGRVYAATCRLAAVRLEELAYTLEELAPLVRSWTEGLHADPDSETQRPVKTDS